jgi:superfamily II helicase
LKYLIETADMLEIGTLIHTTELGVVALQAVPQPVEKPPVIVEKQMFMTLSEMFQAIGTKMIELEQAAVAHGEAIAAFEPDERDLERAISRWMEHSFDISEYKYDIEQICDDQINDYDFGDKIGDAMEDYDLDDKVRTIIQEGTFETTFS